MRKRGCTKMDTKRKTSVCRRREREREREGERGMRGKEMVEACRKTSCSYGGSRLWVKIHVDVLLRVCACVWGTFQTLDLRVWIKPLKTLG